MTNDFTRRQFLEFMGRAGLTASALSLLPGCATSAPKDTGLPFKAISPTRKDDLVLAEGFHYDVVISWGQKLNREGAHFGFNNDYLAFLPLDPKDSLEGLLWVNHEYHDPFYISGWRPGEKRTLKQSENERREVGGSIVHLRYSENRWQFVPDSKYNRRFDAYTPIPLISEHPIEGKRTAIGTLANCAGGVTPWGTVLSCEENYQNFVGDVEFKDGKRHLFDGDKYLSWMEHWHVPPEHYGWVVEIEPKSGAAKKLTALGRFSHESATCIQATDGRCVVYSGDDCDQEHLYKFISSKPGSLEHGTLYVADFMQGRWLPLDRAQDPRLKKAFKTHTELMVRTREAAKMIGATPLNRPEDIEIDPFTRAVFVSLTMSHAKGDTYGSLLKLEEKNADPLSLEFKTSTFLAGGTHNGFANPDNLAFDPAGNLWMCSDISEMAMYKPEFDSFSNNGLFVIPMRGPSAGKAIQVGSAPCGSELTGPYFAADGKTLFLSVQHPGERAHVRPEMTSHWPLGGDNMPKPSVVTISGPALDRLMAVTATPV